MSRQTLTVEEVKNIFGAYESNGTSTLVTEVFFPIDCSNVAIAGRETQRKFTKFETIFLIWKSSDGEVHYRKIQDTRNSKENIYIRRVQVEKNILYVTLSTRGVHEDPAWQATWEYSLHWFN